MATFKITKDIIGDGKLNGTFSSTKDEPDSDEKLTVHFRLYDDDGNRYYEGVMFAKGSLTINVKGFFNSCLKSDTAPV